MAAHTAEHDPVVPPMPERTPKALRRAIAEDAPQLLPDFDEHWKWAIADAYEVDEVKDIRDKARALEMKPLCDRRSRYSEIQPGRFTGSLHPTRHREPRDKRTGYLHLQAAHSG